MSRSILESMKQLTQSEGSTLEIEIRADRTRVDSGSFAGPCTIMELKAWLRDLHRTDGREHAATGMKRDLKNITFREFSDQDGYHFFAVFSEGNMTDYRVYMHGDMHMTFGG